MDQQKIEQTIPNFHSPLTYAVSDAENYYFEFKELNRSLSVHYQGGGFQKGGGREGVYAFNLVNAQK